MRAFEWFALGIIAAAGLELILVGVVLAFMVITEFWLGRKP